jgi:hypothetical protein
MGKQPPKPLALLFGDGPSVPPVLAAALGAVAAGRAVAGQVYAIPVLHEGWCASKQGGPCNCDPDVGAPRRLPRPEEN